MARTISKEWTTAFIEKSNETVLASPNPHSRLWLGLTKLRWGWTVERGENRVEKYFWKVNEPRLDYASYVLSFGGKGLWQTNSLTEKLSYVFCEFSKYC